MTNITSFHEPIVVIVEISDLNSETFIELVEQEAKEREREKEKEIEELREQL